jgi:hypothetical protein
MSVIMGRCGRALKELARRVPETKIPWNPSWRQSRPMPHSRRFATFFERPLGCIEIRASIEDLRNPLIQESM